MRKHLSPNLLDFSDSVTDQILAIRELISGGDINLHNLNTVEKANLVLAINEVLLKANTAVSLEAVDTAVQDYFVLHPQSYTYEQSTPVTSVDIMHPLDHQPAVQVTDSAGTIWRVQVSYPARNQVRIQSNTALAFKAVLT